MPRTPPGASRRVMGLPDRLFRRVRAGVQEVQLTPIFIDLLLISGIPYLLGRADDTRAAGGRDGRWCDSSATVPAISRGPK